MCEPLDLPKTAKKKSDIINTPPVTFEPRRRVVNIISHEHVLYNQLLYISISFEEPIALVISRSPAKALSGYLDMGLALVMRVGAPCRASRSGLRGFGSFQTVTDAFTAIHDFSGLPWLLVVPATTFALRTCLTLPLSIWQRKRLLQQRDLRKIVQAVTPVVKLRLAQASTRNGRVNGGDSPQTALTPDQITLLALKETRKRQKSLYKSHNVPMWKNAILPLVQIPLWVCVSMGIRNLTQKQLIDSNLTQSSPLQPANSLGFEARLGNLDLSMPLEDLPMLAPLVLGTFAMLNVEHSGRMMHTTALSVVGIETAANSTSRISQGLKSVLNVSRLSSIFLMGISSQASFLLTTYWISSQLYSLLQNMLLDWLWPYYR
ncbi:LAMI_0A03422g1_1 [Lachancea mirantina]|uniref:LAMI_0A03422g1_1 n=1 Tax=Lachancea mirantina TaxID=1230905 RepID=A0A1G4IN58_9SACH|nr:LAMI_0A03422g1_1 [Lachancea mirantina]